MRLTYLRKRKTYRSENEGQSYQWKLCLSLEIMASSMTLFLASKPLGIEEILDDRVAIHPIFVRHFQIMRILQKNLQSVR